MNRKHTGNKNASGCDKYVHYCFLKEHSDCVIEVEDDNPLDDRNMKPTLYFAKTMMMIELLIYEYYRISIK